MFLFCRLCMFARQKWSNSYLILYMYSMIVYDYLQMKRDNLLYIYNTIYNVNAPDKLYKLNKLNKLIMTGTLKLMVKLKCQSWPTLGLRVA